MKKKTNNKRKSPKRKFKTNLTRKGLSYTANEIAELYNIDEATVHRWIREEDLITIDYKSPAMVHNETLKQFIIYKNNALKMPIGNEGELPCLKCKLKRKPFQNEVLIEKINDKLFQMKGICECCGSKMNMRIGVINEFEITMTWLYKVVDKLPKFTLIYNSTPNAITNSKNTILKNKFTLQNPINICPENERIKHEYFDKLLNRFDNNKKTVRQIVYSLEYFEKFTKYMNFKNFNYETAKNFKKYIKEQPKDIKTAYRILYNLKEFLFWLKDKEGYKKLQYDDIKTLEIQGKDKEKLNAVVPKEIISLNKIEEITLIIRPINEIELRIKSLLSFLLLANSIRIESSLQTKIGDVNLEQSYVYQRDPKTGRPQRTDFLNFKIEIKQILIDWIHILKTQYNFTNEDPLFPAIRIIANNELQFEKSGFKKEFIKPNAIRKELQKHFEGYNFTPHIVRHSLTYFFFECGLTKEQEKAFSQNMGHKSLFTTYNSYYNINEIQQTQIIRKFDIEEMRKKNEIKDMPEYQYILSKMNDKEEIKRVFEIMTKKDNES